MAISTSEPDRTQATISLGNEHEVLDLVANSIMGLWDVVNDLTRLRPTRRDRYRVTIFGSARIPQDHWVYAAVRDVAEELTRLGCDIVTGGGPGLMAAANEGTRRADPEAAIAQSVGIRVELPFEQDVNAFVTQAYEHRTFFTRLQQFVLMSDAFVVMPGGIGTVLEAMMIWQLLQVGHLQVPRSFLSGKCMRSSSLGAGTHASAGIVPRSSGGSGSAAMCGRRSRNPQIVREHHATWAEARKQNG